MTEAEVKKPPIRYSRRKRYRIIFERDEGICQICMESVKFSEGTVDHIRPRSHNGTNDWDNLQLAHSLCNLIKGSTYECECGLPNNAPGCRIGVEKAWELYLNELEWRMMYREWINGKLPKLKKQWTFRPEYLEEEELKAGMYHYIITVEWATSKRTLDGSIEVKEGQKRTQIFNYLFSQADPQNNGVVAFFELEEE